MEMHQKYPPDIRRDVPFGKPNFVWRIIDWTSYEMYFLDFSFIRPDSHKISFTLFWERFQLDNQNNNHNHFPLLRIALVETWKNVFFLEFLLCSSTWWHEFPFLHDFLLRFCWFNDTFLRKMFPRLWACRSIDSIFILLLLKSVTEICLYYHVSTNTIFTAMSWNLSSLFHLDHFDSSDLSITVSHCRATISSSNFNVRLSLVSCSLRFVQWTRLGKAICWTSEMSFKTAIRNVTLS